MEQSESVTLDQTSETLTQDQNTHNNTDKDCKLDGENIDFPLYIYIYALIKDGFIYQYNFSLECDGNTCSQLPRLAIYSLVISFTIRLSQNIMESLEPPWLDYLIKLHDFADNDDSVE